MNIYDLDINIDKWKINVESLKLDLKFNMKWES